MFICFSLETWDQQISSLGKFFWKLQLWWRHFLSLSSTSLLWHWSYQWCICLLSIYIHSTTMKLCSNTLHEYVNTSDTHNPKCIYVVDIKVPAVSYLTTYLLLIKFSWNQPSMWLYFPLQIDLTNFVGYSGKEDLVIREAFFVRFWLTVLYWFQVSQLFNADS